MCGSFVAGALVGGWRLLNALTNLAKSILLLLLLPLTVCCAVLCWHAACRYRASAASCQPTRSRGSHLHFSNPGLCISPSATKAPMLWPTMIAFFPQFFQTAASTRLAMKSNCPDSSNVGSVSRQS